MIHKLRRRFILVTMLSVMLVLLIIMSVINVLNYRNVVRDADSILAMLQAFDGTFPGLDAGFGPGDFYHPGGPGEQNPAALMDAEDPGTAAEAAEDAEVVAEAAEDAGTGGDWDAFQQRNGHGMKRGFGGIGGEFSAETPFESRYFSVLLDEEGSVLDADTARIAAVSTDQAYTYAQKVWEKKQNAGFVGCYRYLKYVTADGETSVLFLDCQRSLSNFRSFLLISVLVSLAGFAAVLVLVILLSGRVVRPVQESYEKQKRFITDAGHELKTPLTIIDADVSVLEMDIGENEWIEDVRAQTKRLAGLTSDLIYLSRMDETNTELQKIDFPLSDIAVETAQSFRGRAQVEGKTFTTEIEPLLSFHGEEKSIRQLMTILLDNAVKYANDGGDIFFRVRQKGKNVEIEVSNTTDGVDPDTLAHMFDRFYRADKSRNSGKGGYGIGLSIASAVVAAHKGKISAQSPDGKMMRIVATLP